MFNGLIHEIINQIYLVSIFGCFCLSQIIAIINLWKQTMLLIALIDIDTKIHRHIIKPVQNSFSTAFLFTFLYFISLAIVQFFWYQTISLMPFILISVIYCIQLSVLQLMVFYIQSVGQFLSKCLCILNKSVRNLLYTSYRPIIQEHFFETIRLIEELYEIKCVYVKTFAWQLLMMTMIDFVLITCTIYQSVITFMRIEDKSDLRFLLVSLYVLPNVIKTLYFVNAMEELAQKVTLIKFSPFFNILIDSGDLDGSFDQNIKIFVMIIFILYNVGLRKGNQNIYSCTT